MKVEHRMVFAASPEDVYDVITDPARLEDWVTIHDDLIDAPPAPLEAGAELTQRLKLAGRCFTVHWTVVESDRPTRVVWEGRGPARSRAGVTYELRAQDGGSDFYYSNEYHLPGGPLGKAAGPIVARVTKGELEASLKKLRTLVE